MIIRSPLPEITIPELTLHQLALARAAELGTKPALIDGPTGRVLTYAALADGVERMATNLAARGHRSGDVIGLAAPNSPEYALAFLGVSRLGGVVTPMSPLATANEMARQLTDAGATTLITVPGLLDRVPPTVTRTYFIGQAELRQTDAPAAPDPAAPDDLVALPYSSGTTGMPKGVMLTHRNLVANVLQVGVQADVSEDEVLLGVLPFFHIYGLVVVMALALSRGATVVTMPRYDLAQMLDLVERHRITRAMLVPPIILALAKSRLVDGRDLSSLRIVKSGAAPLDASLANAAAARIGAVIVQGYGMTEASPVTNLVADADGMRKPGSIGPLVPNTEARVVDVAGGADLGPEADGELLVRGPQVMRGYLHDPGATARTLDADGWLHTGDVARVDADGWFTIVDRVKELIKVRGHAVAPAELEAVLVSHPAVRDAAVVGMHDAEAGELPRAFVVLSDPIATDALLAWVAERVAPYKRIRSLQVVDSVPRSASGKILRRQLVERDPDARHSSGGR